MPHPAPAPVDLFVWIYGVSTQFVSAVTYFKATPGFKIISTAGAKKCIAPVIRTHLVASYDHTGINGGCNYYASRQPLNHKSGN
jgi:hypothetical protein